MPLRWPCQVTGRNECDSTTGLLLAMLALPGAAHAQSSQKPIQIIVPFAPGGSADGIARILATELGARLGRQVYVENKPGAGGSLGLTRPGEVRRPTATPSRSPRPARW